MFIKRRRSWLGRWWHRGCWWDRGGSGAPGPVNIIVNVTHYNDHRSYSLMVTLIAETQSWSPGVWRLTELWQRSHLEPAQRRGGETSRAGLWEHWGWLEGFQDCLLFNLFKNEQLQLNSSSHGLFELVAPPAQWTYTSCMYYVCPRQLVSGSQESVWIMAVSICKRKKNYPAQIPAKYLQNI